MAKDDDISVGVGTTGGAHVPHAKYKADAAGIVLGARAPIILTSRADSVRTRMASCAAAVLYAHARAQTIAIAAS